MSNAFSFDDDEEETPPFDDQSTETEMQDDEPGEEGESGNRAFYIVGIVLGVLFLCTLIGGAAYALWVLPGQQAARLDAQNTLVAVNTEAAIAVALTQEVMNYTPTLPPTETPTPVPTFTPVLVDPATETPGAGLAPRDANADATATVVALNTELANAQLTVTLMPTVTALSNTGFADDVGLPGLFVGAIVLVAVILLVRRLRESPAKQ
ncbi:MAG TPA: hypothetical protein DCG54_12955 [Anaerolineae bacterium]|jgi:hypothetical protein|nr:hypothetical protein [Anaerolineae bacterium]